MAPSGPSLSLAPRTSGVFGADSCLLTVFLFPPALRVSESPLLGDLAFEERDFVDDLLAFPARPTLVRRCSVSAVPVVDEFDLGELELELIQAVARALEASTRDDASIRRRRTGHRNDEANRRVVAGGSASAAHRRTVPVVSGLHVPVLDVLIRPVVGDMYRRARCAAAECKRGHRKEAGKETRNETRGVHMAS